MAETKFTPTQRADFLRQELEHAERDYLKTCDECRKLSNQLEEKLSWKDTLHGIMVDLSKEFLDAVRDVRLAEDGE